MIEHPQARGIFGAALGFEAGEGGIGLVGADQVAKGPARARLGGIAGGRAARFHVGDFGVAGDRRGDGAAIIGAERQPLPPHAPLSRGGFPVPGGRSVGELARGKAGDLVLAGHHVTLERERAGREGCAGQARGSSIGNF